MKNYFQAMRVLNILLLLVLLVCIDVQCVSQGTNESPKKTQDARGPVSSAQTTQIKAILSNYNPASLTADQAKEIHEKFRAAGIHPGPETKDAIISAGFDPEKLRALAPPPPRDESKGNSPNYKEDRMNVVDEKIIKPLSLNSSQSETVSNAFKEFFSGMDRLRQTEKDSLAPLEKSKIDPLEKIRDEMISQVLSKEQFMKYRELEKAARPPRPDQKDDR